ncbi:hypothetical protein [Roseibacillus persicicus]|uniref:Membrane protein n=1 Tax=Roseibacillus persicicus TaxID=454148 RepID=A0A918WIS8_9BACT|nr:hypothetical protein [Roseibacillus persicicus]MDQ8189405.1 hypothetical protein [Roseibacillus persicicus]GHC55560.1 membrane protein [Roseibacillus persicicus]
MQFQINQLHFAAPSVFVWLGLLFLVAIGFYCWTAFRRATRPVRTGSLELLRFLIASLVVLLLLQPEWHRVINPTDEPEIVILADASGSMTTVDAPENPDGARPKIISRAELTQKVLESEFYLPLLEDGKTTVNIETFGIPPENPEPGMQPGTNLEGALSSLLENRPNLRSVVLLSDGEWNQGKPPVTAAQKFRLRDIPIFSVPMGSEVRLPDLDLVAVSAPTYGIVGENVQIPFTIRSSLDRDLRTIVRLRDSSGNEISKDLSIPARSTVYESILYRLQKEGSNTLTLTIPPANGELLPDNNSRQFTLSGKPEDIRVLVIDTLPRWEYRFIRNALSRDPGVQVDCLLLHPKLGAGNGPDYIQEFPEKTEDLQKYDVVFLGDIGIAENQLTVEQAELLKGLVENQASGLVFIPGSQGNWLSLLDSPLGDLMPVLLDKTQPSGFAEATASPLELTTEGRSSLLTMLADSEDQNPAVWSSLPGFFWHAPVLRAKSGTEVLAVHSNRRNDYGRIPLLVTNRVGSGKVLFLGHDSAWRWRRGVEDLYHYRFWGQVARWMSYQRNIATDQRIRLYFSPERPKPGDRVTLTANVFDANGAPLKEGPIPLDLTQPSGKTTRIELKSTEAENTWGTFNAQFAVNQAGEWKVDAYLPGESSDAPQLSTVILAQDEQLEKVGQPAKLDVLEELASISRGQVAEAADLPGLLKELQLLPTPRPQVIPLRLWAHPAVAIVLISLLGLFWTGRKLNGTF